MGRRSATDDLPDGDVAAPVKGTAPKAGKAPKAAKPAKPGKGRRSRRAHGPISMWRFPVSVAAGVLISAPALLSAVQSDTSLLDSGQLDGVLMRGAGFGLVVWFATGVVDRILHAARPDDSVDEPTPS